MFHFRVTSAPVRLIATALYCLVWSGCCCSAPGRPAAAAPDYTANPSGERQRTVFEIPIPSAWKKHVRPGNGKKECMEFSGMAWYGDYLVLLPQLNNAEMLKPEQNPCLYASRKSDILARIPSANRETPRESSPLPAIAVNLTTEEPLLKHLLELNAFEGFEAIAFRGDTVYIAVEYAENGDKRNMGGILLQGKIDLANRRIILSRSSAPPSLKAPVPVKNAAFESLLITPEYIVMIYEANGESVNPEPRAWCFSHDMQFIKTIPFPGTAFRVTDATAVDSNGFFYALNYFFPGDCRDYNITNAIAPRDAHGDWLPVEQILSFHYTPDGVQPVPERRWILKAAKGEAGANSGRNWEGLETLRDDNGEFLGFLLITDEYPDTMLGFAPR